MLVGLDIHHGMFVIQLHFYSLCQLCLTQYCPSPHSCDCVCTCIYLTVVAFKIIPELNNWGRPRWRMEQKFRWSRPVHLWMKPLKKTDTKQGNSSNTVSCSMNIPAQPPLDCFKGPFVQWVTSSALMAHMDPLTHQHALGGVEGHQGTTVCRCRYIVLSMLKSRYQPFLAGPWHRRCDPRNRQRSVEWGRVCLEPVGGVGGKGMSGREKTKQNKTKQAKDRMFGEKLHISADHRHSPSPTQGHIPLF